MVSKATTRADGSENQPDGLANGQHGGDHRQSGLVLPGAFCARRGLRGLPAELPRQAPPLVDSANLEALVPGMLAVMQRGGTAPASSLADVGIAVAGKTGTVQND